MKRVEETVVQNLNIFNLVPKKLAVGRFSISCEPGWRLLGSVQGPIGCLMH